MCMQVHARSSHLILDMTLLVLFFCFLFFTGAVCHLVGERRDKPGVWTCVSGRTCEHVPPFFISLRLINPIIGFLWFSGDFIAGSTRRLPARRKEINHLLLQMIWFSHSSYSVRYDHPLWPKILQKSCYSSPLPSTMTPLEVQKLCVCGSGVGERDSRGGEKDYLGKCTLLMCRL